MGHYALTKTIVRSTRVGKLIFNFWAIKVGFLGQWANQFRLLQFMNVRLNCTNFNVPCLHFK